MTDKYTVDIDPETPAAPAPEPAAEAAPDPLAAANAEIVDLRDRLLRAAAEIENVRRRLEREKTDATQYAATNFARDLLGVADNMRRAIAAIPDTDAALKPLMTGIEMTEKELLSVFAKHGIARVDAVGARLDPNRHQAMVELEHEAEPGTVIQELQAGYTLRDRLLRPALVAVAKPKVASEADVEAHPS